MGVDCSVCTVHAIVLLVLTRTFWINLYVLNFKDDVHSCTHVQTLFTFWTTISVKYDILTDYLTLFWFAMLVNEYKLYVSIQKSSKDAKFGQCLYLGVPPLLWAELMRRTEWTSSLKISTRWVLRLYPNHWSISQTRLRFLDYHTLSTL